MVGYRVLRDFKGLTIEAKGNQKESKRVMESQGIQEIDRFNQSLNDSKFTWKRRTDNLPQIENV